MKRHEISKHTKYSRRNVLKIMGVATGGGIATLALNACGPAPAPTAAPAGEQPAAPAEQPAAPAEQPAAGESKWAKVTRLSPKADWTPTYPATKPYDPPVVFSLPANGGYQWKEGESYTNNPYAWMREELLGIKYDIRWEAYGEVRQQKLKADLAAGDPPDMWVSSGADLTQLIADEVVEDITAIWEATASPLVKEKKLYPKGDNWIPAIRGGKVYGVAFSYGPAYNVDNIGYLRLDFLEKIGGKMPETVDDITAMLKAFKEQGLCQYGINACKKLVTWHNSLDPIFGAYGVMPGLWRKAADGTLQYDSIQPAVKTVLGIIRQWYADGLIDPDYYTKGEGDADSNMAQGKIGLRYSPWWAQGYASNMEKADPTVKWGLTPYPKGPEGKTGRRASGMVGPVVVFKKGIDPRKIEAALADLNFEMDLHVNWEKYQQYGHASHNGTRWLENYEYVWDGDDIKLTDTPSIYAMADEIGFTFPWLCYPDYQFDVNKLKVKWFDLPEDQLNKSMKVFVVGEDARLTKKNMDAYAAIYDTLDVAVFNEYKAPPTEEMAKVAADMGKLENETFNAIVVGNQPLDSFDDFVKEWKAVGGDIWTAGVNDWYKTVSK